MWPWGKEKEAFSNKALVACLGGRLLNNFLANSMLVFWCGSAGIVGSGRAVYEDLATCKRRTRLRQSTLSSCKYTPYRTWMAQLEKISLGFQAESKLWPDR